MKLEEEIAELRRFINATVPSTPYNLVLFNDRQKFERLLDFTDAAIAALRIYNQLPRITARTPASKVLAKLDEEVG